MYSLRLTAWGYSKNHVQKAKKTGSIITFWKDTHVSEDALCARVGYWSSFKLLSSCTQPCLSHISIFLQTDLVWCKCLSHLHGETTMCCVYSHGSLCLHVWDSLQTQYIHDILSCIPLTEHMFVPDTNAASSLLHELEGKSLFQLKILGSRRYSASDQIFIDQFHNLSDMLLCPFSHVAFYSQPRWPLLFRSMHRDLCCF